MSGTNTEFSATHFAITTVNIPDRLDQREVDDRKLEDQESSLQAVRRSILISWVRRIWPYLAVLVVLALGGFWLSGQRETLTAGRVSQRLSSVLHVPVRIQDTRVRTAPSPALVLTGVDLGARLHFDQIDLEFTAPSLWQSVVEGQRHWGDVVISPTAVNLEQARQMLAWLGMMDRIVPNSVNKVRFKQISFVGSRLLPDHYEAYTRRDANGLFSTIKLSRVELPGTMQFQITPQAGATSFAFQCDSTDWQPPFVPRAAWSEFVASGHVTDSSVEVEKFSLASAFGGLEGHLSVRHRDHGEPAWQASGQINTVGLDIPTIIQQIVPHDQRTVADSPGAATSMAGTAAINAALAGVGDTFEGTLAELVADGEIHVRSAELNGINLGYVASKPSTMGSVTGGTTRFTQFSAHFTGSSRGLALHEIKGVAGAMSTHGEMVVTPDLNLAGILHVDLGGSRIQAPLRIHVRGTLGHPQFGR